MAEVTTTGVTRFDTVGSRYVVTATLSSPADGDTWTPGLRDIDYASFTIVEASGDAADAIAVGSISNGVITLDVAGTVTSALARAEGV